MWRQRLKPIAIFNKGVNLLKIKDILVGAAEAGMVEALGEPAGYGSGSVRLC